MQRKNGEQTLQFLLGFNGHAHRYPSGYWLKFEITKVEANDGKPHGLDYSFALHGPDNRRLIGFDNAHSAPAKGARFKKRPKAMDHWHRTEKKDEGRPYAFKDADSRARADDGARTTEPYTHPGKACGHWFRAA